MRMIFALSAIALVLFGISVICAGRLLRETKVGEEFNAVTDSVKRAVMIEMRDEVHPPAATLENSSDSCPPPSCEPVSPWRKVLAGARYDPLRDPEHHYWFWRSLDECAETLRTVCNDDEVNRLMQFCGELALAYEVFAEKGQWLLRLPSPERCRELKRITLSTFHAALGDERSGELLIETMPPRLQEELFGAVFRPEYRIPSLMNGNESVARFGSIVWNLLDPTREM